jgi:hypothetical protein
VNDSEKMKQFMESFGEKKFTEAQMKMIHEFCCGGAKVDPQAIKALMEKCECAQPQTVATESEDLPPTRSRLFRAEVRQLKEMVADLFVESRMLKKEHEEG